MAVQRVDQGESQNLPLVLQARKRKTTPIHMVCMWVRTHVAFMAHNFSACANQHTFDICIHKTAKILSIA